MVRAIVPTVVRKASLILIYHWLTAVPAILRLKDMRGKSGEWAAGIDLGVRVSDYA